VIHGSILCLTRTVSLLSYLSERLYIFRLLWCLDVVMFLLFGFLSFGFLLFSRVFCYGTVGSTTLVSVSWCFSLASSFVFAAAAVFVVGGVVDNWKFRCNESSSRDTARLTHL
jgi:hypothetical protein